MEKKKTNNRHNNYIVVIAHPDDESMFFLPALYCILRRNENNINIHILCLSNGNYDKLGSIREIELKVAVEIIANNVAKEKNSRIKVTIVNNADLQDGPHETWEPDVIAETLHNFLSSEKLHEGAVLMTFDEGGVSGHINHVHTYEGVLHYYNLHTKGIHISSCNTGTVKDEVADGSKIKPIGSDMKLWTLVSIQNPLIKYVPILTILQVLWRLMFAFCIQLLHIFLPNKKNAGSSTISGTIRSKHDEGEMIQKDIHGRKRGAIRFYMVNPFLVWKAMKAHHSQFVWYRRLFVVFSRYSYVNDFTTYGTEDDAKVKGMIAPDMVKMASKTSRAYTRKGNKSD